MKNCNLNEILLAVEQTINNIFGSQISFLSSFGEQACYQASSNIFSAIFLGAFFPFIEAFFPMLPLTAFLLINISLLGFVLGSLVSIIGAVLGGLVVFLLTRFLFREKLVNYLKRKNKQKTYQKVSLGVEKHGISYLILGYGVLGLIVPSSFLTITLALTKISKRDFLIGLIAGRALFIIVFSLFGESVFRLIKNPVLLIVFLLVITGGYYFNRNRFNNHFDM